METIQGRKLWRPGIAVSVTQRHSPSQSAPTILKNRAPCFLKNGAPCFLQKAGWKKQGHSLFKKRRDQAASSLFELQWPWIFALCFFQKAGCPIFKNSGCRLTGRVGNSLVWMGSVQMALELAALVGMVFVWTMSAGMVFVGMAFVGTVLVGKTLVGKALEGMALVTTELARTYLQPTIAFHCSKMASLSDWTSGQSKNLKKESKLSTRAFQITYFILILIYRWIRFFSLTIFLILLTLSKAGLTQWDLG